MLNEITHHSSLRVYAAPVFRYYFTFIIDTSNTFLGVDLNIFAMRIILVQVKSNLSFMLIF